MISYDASLAGTVAYLVWVGFAAVATIWGVVYWVEMPAEAHELPAGRLSEAEAGALSNSLFADARSARAQQWNTACVSLLLLAAIVALSRLPRIADVALLRAWLLPLFTDCVWGVSIIAVLVYQRLGQRARIQGASIALSQRPASELSSGGDGLLREGSLRFSSRFTWIWLFMAVITAGWLLVEYLLAAMGPSMR